MYKDYRYSEILKFLKKVKEEVVIDEGEMKSSRPELSYRLETTNNANQETEHDIV
jgi:hypothetical protein